MTTLQQLIALRDEMRKALAKEEEHALSIAGPRGRSGPANVAAATTVQLHGEFIRHLDEIIAATENQP